MKKILLAMFCGVVLMASPSVQALEPRLEHYTAKPPLMNSITKPMLLMVLSRDHKMFFQAYSNTSDINGDGKMDIGFNPEITYLGYFDSKTCYRNNGSMFVRSRPSTPDGGTAVPSAIVTYNKNAAKIEAPLIEVPVSVCGVCPYSGEWSGNWLNWIVTSRMDALRKVLYGGKRSKDTPKETILEPTRIPQDAHAWGSEVWSDDSWPIHSAFAPYYNINQYTPYAKPNSGQALMVIRFDYSIRVASNIAFKDQGRVWDWIISDSNNLGGAQNNLAKGTANTFADYTVRVQVCDKDNLEDSLDCVQYPNEYSKPYGLLQQYSETDQIAFGLFTGSNTLRMFGGVLRHNIGMIKNQIDADTGVFASKSIMRTIDTFYIEKGSNIRALGNPIGEMAYEALRYMSAVEGSNPPTNIPTSHFINVTGNDEGSGKPATWVPPDTSSSVPYCSQPIIMAISDIYNSFDADNIPGTKHHDGWKMPMALNLKKISSLNITDVDIKPLLSDKFDVNTYLEAITNHEKINAEIGPEGNKWQRTYYVANNNPAGKGFNGNIGDDDDNNCTGKKIDNLADVRGLCPTEPQFYGSYSVAAVAYYAHINDVLPGFDDDQPAEFYSIAMSSPFPEITFTKPGTQDRISLAPLGVAIKESFNINGDIKKYLSTPAINTFVFKWLTDKNNKVYSGAIFVNFDDNLDVGGDYDRDVPARYYFDLIMPCGEDGIVCPINGIKVTPTDRTKYPRSRTGKFAEADGSPVLDAKDVLGSRETGNDIYRNYEYIYAPKYLTPDGDEVIDWYGYMGEAGKVYKKVTKPAEISKATGVSIYASAANAGNNGHTNLLGYVITGTETDGGYLVARADTVYRANMVYHKFNAPPPCLKPGQWEIASYPKGSGTNVPNFGVGFSKPAVGACGDWHLPVTSVRLFKFGNPTRASAYLPDPLWMAAKYGGFKDINKDGVPDDGEWDTKVKGTPDNYFFVANPLELKKQLESAFKQITSHVTTSTANSSSVNAILDGGVTIRTYFISESTYSPDEKKPVKWLGGVYALFVDSWGNMREDTDGDGRLDLTIDRVLVFTGETNASTGVPQVMRYQDLLGNGDYKDKGKYIDTVSLFEVKTLWDVAEKLAELSDEQVTVSRGYSATGKGRRVYAYTGTATTQLTSEHLFNDTKAAKLAKFMLLPSTISRPITFNGTTGVYKMFVVSVNSTKTINFSIVEPPINSQASKVVITTSYSGIDVVNIIISRRADANALDVVSSLQTNLTASNYIKAYLMDEHDLGLWILETSSPQTMNKGTDPLTVGKDMINYVLGKEIYGWRSRTVNTNVWKNADNLEETVWRVGDVINSQPAISGNPLGSYELLFGDNSFSKFKQAWGNRRQVAFFGANDGMLHAVNLGFYGSLKDGSSGYIKNPAAPEAAGGWDKPMTRYNFVPDSSPSGGNYVATDTSYSPSAHEIGKELWAFVPKSILPHLQWLPNPDYDHSYYVDMRPVVMSVRNTTTKTYGHWKQREWRTVLLCGVRMGGRTIDMTGATTENPPYSYSEIFALDVTDPESEPHFLWSFSDKDLGMVSGTPSIVRHGDNWYVVAGTGPNWDAATGEPVANGNIAYYGYSNRTAKVFILDAFTGAKKRVIDTGISNSFFGDTFGMVAQNKLKDSSGQYVNANGAWYTPAIYMGMTQSPQVSSSSPFRVDNGALYRLQTMDSNGNPLSVNNWELKKFFDAERPVSAAPTAAIDKSNGQIWVYFGTGRYWNDSDSRPCVDATGVGNAFKCQKNHLNYFFGIKEPMRNGKLTFEEVSNSATMDYNTSSKAIYDVSNVVVKEDGSITGFKNNSDAAELRKKMRGPDVAGFKRALKTVMVLDSNGSENSKEAKIDFKVPELTHDNTPPGNDKWWENVFYEMSLSQPAIVTLEGQHTVFFTTHRPSDDVCNQAGDAFMWMIDGVMGIPRFDLTKQPGYYPSKDAAGKTISGFFHLGTGVPTAPSVVVTKLGTAIMGSDALGKLTNLFFPGGGGSRIISWREVLDMGFNFDDSEVITIPN